jgi:hypothetical protein
MGNGSIRCSKYGAGTMKSLELNWFGCAKQHEHVNLALLDRWDNIPDERESQ